MPTSADTLRTLAEKARHWRLAGDHHDGYESEFPLMGYCFDNAYVLYHLLQTSGYDPVLVEGTTERVAEDLIRNDIDLTGLDSTEELAGHVHYWIETEINGETWYLDIASDTDTHLGECLVTTTLPDEYVILPDSYEEGASLIEQVKDRGDRCQYCGDHTYTEGGCPQCQSLLAADLET